MFPYFSLFTLQEMREEKHKVELEIDAVRAKEAELQASREMHEREYRHRADKLVEKVCVAVTHVYNNTNSCATLRSHN